MLVSQGITEQIVSFFQRHCTISAGTS